MADKTEKTCGENHSIFPEVQELLRHFSSTVFACDISGDTRYIRCDFPQCRQHAEALQGKPCWILNTLKNVKVLESHVGKEVHHYMKEVDSGTNDQVANLHYADSRQFIQTQELPEGTRKVLAVFNLKDPQSQFGDWISLFLKAAFLSEGLQQNGCVVITQNFVSRHELMECIAKLKFLNTRCPSVEVVTVLSCHSSCQGQVFSCTPFAFGKRCGFEEFCSLHDFVMACQSVLKDVLMAVHISSCFTLKLDCSHAEWPVDADWLKTKLQCILSGSTKEVYETGSQVADLHLMLSSTLPSVTGGTCGTQLRDAVHRARVEGFPDLAREMGLVVLGPDNVDEMLSREGKEDQVTPPGLVMSSVRVVLLVQDESPSTLSKDSDETIHSGSYVALADAIVANLQIRKASDVKFEYTIIRMKHDETSLFKELLKKRLSLLPRDSFKVLYVAIGPMFSRPNIELIDLIREWNNQRTGDICYGVHFQHVTAMQAYVIKNKLKEIQDVHAPANGADLAPSEGHLAVTGLVDNGNRNCSVSFPVLLYMMHLAVGENGNRLAGKGIPSAVYSNKPVGHGVSSWTLEEVYMETCHVLSGLSRKCGLHLLSPASQPVTPTLAISTCPQSVFTPPSGVTLELSREKRKHADGCDVKFAASIEDAGTSSSVTRIPVNAGATDQEGNALLSVHNDDGSSNLSNCNSISTTGYEEPVGVVSHDKPISTTRSFSTNSNILGSRNNAEFGNKQILKNEKPDHVTMVTEAGLSERDGSISESYGKIVAVNEEPDKVICYDKPSLTINALVDYASSSEEEEEEKLTQDEDRLDDEPVGLACLQKESLTIGAFLEDASLPGEGRIAPNADKEPVGVRIPEKPSSTIDLAVTNLTSPEDKRSRVKLDSEGPVGLPCREKELLTNNPVLDDAPLLEDGENTFNLDHARDNLDEEPVGLVCLKKESAIISTFLADESLSAEETSILKLRQGDSELAAKPVSVICAEKPSSTVEEGSLEGEECRGNDGGKSCVPSNRDAKAYEPDLKGPSVANPDDKSGSTPQHDTGTKTPFQTWLQNFRKYCKEKKHVERREGSSDPPRKRRKKTRVPSVEKDCMSGNLESKNKCLGVTKGTGVFEVRSCRETACGMSSTTASSALSELNVENTSEEHAISSSRAEGQTELNSARNAKNGCVYGSEMCFAITSSSLPKLNLENISDDHVVVPSHTEGETETDLARYAEAVQFKETGCDFVSGMNSSSASSSVSGLNFGSPSDEHVVTPSHLERETETDCARNSDTFHFEERGCIFMSGMSSTTMSSSLPELNLGNISAEDVVPSRKTKSHSVRNSETAEFKNTNLFEILESKEGDVDSEDSCVKKRGLFIDYSSDVEESSTKKLKRESDCKSKCEATVEESLISASNEWDKSEDLPLMANVDEVLVNHYILDLSVKFSEQIMKGSIVLFLEPRNEEVTKRQFQMTLDSTLVNIESVSEVVLPEDFKLKFFAREQNDPLTQKASASGVFNGFLGGILGDNNKTPLPFKGLPYSVYGWFVRIWKPDATGKAWPRCIWIKYHTSPEGKSLTWATDQDGKPCVYSPGAYINNRSLMPCQEPPVAMSTWQASIHVPEGCVVLMSGNELVGKTTASDGQVSYLYEMGTALPCSTLAVAVGWWQCRQSRNADTRNGANPGVPVTCRLFAPPSMIDGAADELLGYAPKFLEASCELLGPYPFRRLDMLILPKCFACMGLKSPNLVFLSQSLLSGDASMRVRLAHEISHAWFGLLVGAKDWSEEWLSEGFATFVEEKIQSRAEKWPKDKDRFYREIRQILRHRCLLAEIKECDNNLRYLRPKVVKPSKALSTAEAIEKSASQPDAVRPHTVVQFGQICSRKWTQVHYLKGYFLLHNLAVIVGLEEFDSFLFKYVEHYKEQLVSSEDFFEFFVQSFPDVSSETMEKFIHEWLERAGLPKSFPKRFDSPDNELVSQVEEEFQIWKKHDTTNKRNKTLRVRKRTKPPTTRLELPEQVVLFLEKLLERETLSHNTLRQLDKCYNFAGSNAEVRHRWCELVVKHKYNPGLPEVKRFLVEDQGMGIYLFGELIISQQPKQRALVDEVLEEISAEMDRCTYQTVKDMLEGND